MKGFPAPARADYARSISARPAARCWRSRTAATSGAASASHTEPERDAQPSLESLKSAVADLMERCGKPLLQLSGGEPTMRDDLPELTRYARSLGCEHIQLNTNGIRLAQEPDYARALRDAGVSIIFLQFDALDNAAYKVLRARPLLELKKRAIAVCDALKMGVTLVPTVVRSVNDDQLGALLHFAAENVPAVRGVHLQPVSYFGRIPKRPDPAARITLDELIWMLCEQTGLPADCFLPSRCDHPMCGFHAQLLVEPQGGIRRCCGKRLPDATRLRHKTAPISPAAGSGATKPKALRRVALRTLSA